MNCFYNKHTCGTCIKWNQRYPENKGLGDCEMVNVMGGKDHIALTPGTDFRDKPEPVRDVAILRTTANFGCVCYMPA